MRQLSRADYELIDNVALPIVERHGLKGCAADLGNPFLFLLYASAENEKEKVVAAANEIFHKLGVLPAKRTLQASEGSEYCYVAESEDGEYMLAFNHPVAMSFKACDEEYQYTIKYDSEQQEKAALELEAEVLALVDGIKSGKLKSKTPDGYLVLKGQFYDAIDSGKKTVEYRDFTEYNIKRTIGLKTARFNRGYVKNAPQMKWEVKKVVLLDCDDNECDPFNVPEDFWPTTIALHLGKRIKDGEQV